MRRRVDVCAGMGAEGKRRNIRGVAIRQGGPGFDFDAGVALVNRHSGMNGNCNVVDCHVLWLVFADKYRRKPMTGKARTEQLAVASGSYTERHPLANASGSVLVAPSVPTEFAVGFIRPDDEEF